ncbi:autotransporter domain-containing protein [Methylobacterium sp. DB1607]|nr:autotransporter domain-containing protein [Methylobacterium sp. DB1607]
MSASLPAARLPISLLLLGTTMLTWIGPAPAQSVDAAFDLALRDVVRAAYVRAGQPKTEAELGALAASARPLVSFDPRSAREADIVDLVARLGLRDASLPPPAAPVSLTRTLSKDPLPDYAGAPDLTQRSVSELAGLLQRGETTSREIVLQYLYKIQRFDHAGTALRSVQQINPDLLAIADRMDAQRAQARASGQALPTLFGIPILVKDNIGTDDGLRTLASSAALIGSKPAEDAVLIKQLREQGAIILGKTNMSEWACFRAGCEVSGAGGTPIHPFDPTAFVSGSSTGSGIAAAMRFAPVTLGTETNGSIIGPSVNNNVYALKPTQGIVSRTGVIPAAAILDTVGPIGTSVKDLALILESVNKFDPADPLSKAASAGHNKNYTSSFGGDLSGLRIGVRTDGSKSNWNSRGLDGREKAAYDTAVNDILSKSSANLVKYNGSDIDNAFKRAVDGLSYQDAASIYKVITSQVLPTDPAGRAEALRVLFRGSASRSYGTFISVLNSTAFAYDLRKGIDTYLGGRVPATKDEAAAFIRLLGDKYKPLAEYAKSMIDVVAFNRNNPELEPSNFFDAFRSGIGTTTLQMALDAGYASTAEFEEAINQQRIAAVNLMKGIRSNLGVDVILDAEFSQSDFAYAMSPQISIPITVSSQRVNILVDADPYREDVLLRIGDYVERQLNTPSLAQYRAVGPSLAPAGFANQPADRGPLLPLVLNDLDDHGRAGTAHLLSTEMAPLVLHTTGLDRTPQFDGRISGNGGLIKDGTGVQALTGTSDFTGTVQVWRGGLAVDRTEALGAGANAITLENSAALIASRSLTLGRTVALRDGGTLGVLAGATLVQDKAISGNGGLTKTGAGQLTLLADNTYTGGTTIQGGTVAVSRDPNLGQAFGAVSIGDNAVLAATASFATPRPIALTGRAGIAVDADATLTATNIVSGSGGLSKLGPGTLSLTGTNTYAGGTTLTGGTLAVTREANLGAVTGGLTFDGGVLRIDGTAFAGTARAVTLARGGGGFDIAEAAHSFTLSQSLSGPGGLTKLGAGTLALAGAATHTGPTAVAAGSLTLAPTASLASPTATLAGATLINAGSLTGGLVNAGATTTSGRIAGGLTNTGTLTATAGQINGAIRNEAGRFTLAGTVSSDATFANAVGAVLAVNGRYSLAGPLTNAGTLAVADGARLTAGSVANAGVLTVAANASVIDALTNTGFLNNAGTYTADATNAAGATLVNTGTFSTVSQPFANAGTLVTTGVLAGGVANTGTVQASGRMDGPVTNSGLVRLTGATAGITRLTNDGGFDLGTTALSVGSLTGGTAAATLGNGRLTVGADDSSTTYAGRIVDGATPTSLTKIGAGTLTLAGDSLFTGPLSVLGGELSVRGTLAGAPARFAAGSLLSGQGTFASLTLEAGGTLAPGGGAGGLGQITVAGNLTLAPGSLYRVDATADGRSDRLLVAGTAGLTGAAVQAVADTGAYAPRTRYTILSAGGGVNGRFAGVSANFAFLTPFLGYAPNEVYLTLARNDLDFRAVARTRNETAAAGAVQAGAVGSPLYDAVAALSAPQARAAFAALAGDAHASRVSTAFATAGLLREAVLDRLRWDAAPGAAGDGPEDRLPAAYAADRPGPPALASVPARVLDPRVFALWGQGFGSTGRAGSDGNAAALSRSTGGFVLGADLRLDDGLRLGLTGGYRSTSFATAGSAETGMVDGVFGGAYGAYRAGPVSLRFGALASDDAVSLRRLVVFPGFSGTPSVRTGGTTVQGFGELGYRFAGEAGPDGTAALLEPFAGGAVAVIRRDRFAERGGPAALAGAAAEETIPVSTVGLRGQAAVDLGGGLRLLAHGLVGYRHAFAAVPPATRLTVLETGARFTGLGLPIDRHALVAEAGLSAEVAPNTTLGLSYTGQVGPRAQDHAATGSLTLRF